MKFVLDSLNDLKNIETINHETIIHSDQGSRYTSPEYVAKIKELGINQSMSRKGNYIDNAPIESFFGHLKDDVDYKNVKTFLELNETIGECTNYYNEVSMGHKKDDPGTIPRSSFSLIKLRCLFV